MRLYSGTTKSLIEDSTCNRISYKLKDAFFSAFRYQPSVAEVNSWNNSLRAISQVLQAASLLDHGVLLELQLPLTSKRLDYLVTGYDAALLTFLASHLHLRYLVRPARPQNFSIVLPFPAQQPRLLAQWQNRLFAQLHDSVKRTVRT